MPFQKGNRANPGGRPKEKAFTDALRIAVNRDDAEGKKKLHMIAEKLVECAVNGENWAIQQVADRLDGKPAQESTVVLDDKRESFDWTRDELVSFLNDARGSREGAAKANGSSRKADRVH